MIKLAAIALAIVALFIGAVGCFGDPPYVPDVPPSPVFIAGGGSSVGEQVNYYIHAVEYQTNGVNEVVREIQTINVTNEVNGFRKMLVLRVWERETLTNDWMFSGQEFLMKLGTNATGFYKVEAVIE